MEMTHPVLDFPVYGLSDGPDGPRWLDGVEGRLGSPATGVWLGHGSTRRDSRRPWTQVGTFSGDRFPGAGVDADERAAGIAAVAVVDATMPDLANRPDDYGQRLLDVALSRAAGHTGWRQASWMVDHQTVSASVLDWAGAWAAFTTALPEVDVVVIGFGVEPAGLALVEVRDASTYHFDLGRPITFPDTVEQARAAAGVWSDPATVDARWPTHPDHTTAHA
ncbi:hypothetical protein [Nocardioides astragali]|uniref:Uncharacterized protein n=1 Tax=Nocardioides astragali TaxID=1776736 RepID=A0ABW2MWH4_9ACTN|nr:hypothetical protein [Nocardioides astragali]